MIKQKILSKGIDKLDMQMSKKNRGTEKLVLRLTDLDRVLTMKQEGLSHIMSKVKVKFDSVPEGSVDVKNIVLLCEAKLSKLIDLMGVDPQEFDPMELDSEAYDSLLSAKKSTVKARQTGRTKISFMEDNLRNLNLDDLETPVLEGNDADEEDPAPIQSTEERDKSFLITPETAEHQSSLG